MKLIMSSLAVVVFLCGGALADGTPSAAAAEQLVADALRAETAGDAARRASLLDEAVRVAPNYELARWQRGEIRSGDKWLAVEEAQQAAAVDPRRAEYLELRESAGKSFDGQLALARWCRRYNLDDEAWFHWANVVSMQPGNKEALRALGMRWYQNRLLTHDEIGAAKQRTRAARDAAKRWAPRVTNWRREITGDLAAREAALAEIRALADVDAIPALEDVTLEADVSDDLKLVRARQFGRAVVAALRAMPAQEATESLVRHALFSPVPAVQEGAIAALRERPLHGYVPMLLDALAMPIESTFQVATDSDGSVHYWHSLYREGATADWSLEARRSVVQLDLNGANRVTDRAGDVLTEWRESDAQIAAKKAWRAASSKNRFGIAAGSMEQRVATINENTEAVNQQLVSILAATTGQNFGNDPMAWWNWWNNYNYYSTEGETPVYEQRYVDTELRYYREPTESAYAPHSCFAAGTPVWTKTGLQPIESIQIGDFVLAQHSETGELAYKGVVGTTIRPARPTIALKLGREKLQTTLGHPLWVSGVGWKLAKDLQADSVLHSTGGPVIVEECGRAEDVDVYNLIVADFNTYFVGESGVLVHDNTPRQATTATVPGLAVK
jgi:hypothetical protein